MYVYLFLQSRASGCLPVWYGETGEQSDMGGCMWDDIGGGSGSNSGYENVCGMMIKAVIVVAIMDTRVRCEGGYVLLFGIIYMVGV